VEPPEEDLEEEILLLDDDDYEDESVQECFRVSYCSVLMAH
jgi:hypothetical protein